MRSDLSLLLPRPHQVDPHAGAPCLTFLNSTDTPGRFNQHDDLQPGYANVLSWAWANELLDDEDTRRLLAIARRTPREASAVRRRIIEFRDALRRLVTAAIAGDPPVPDDLAFFERELRETYAHGRIAPGDTPPRYIWAWPETPQLESILWTIVRSAEDILFSERIDRVRLCAGDGCEKVFLDTSKNRSRRYCSTGGCGNRERVRRFRQDAGT
ncbi:MAG TPA: CGNR zinc finger domain-containing protein [Thermomicrobiales bacterium]|nr:CGNR zinc finger domain-containing protein [Thermomicrobiales bacterium]